MINKAILVGRLGKDATVRRINEKFWVAETTIATDDSYKKKDGSWENVTDWHNITLTNPSDNLIARLTKGVNVYIEGKIKTEKWEDQNGKHSITKIKASTVRVFKSNTGEQRASATPQTYGSNELDPDYTEDLPF